jgi:hypothetical protein
VRVGACGYILSLQVLNGTTFQGPNYSGIYPVLQSPPGVTIGDLGVCRAGLRGGATAGGQVAKSHSFVAIEMEEMTGT